MKYTRRIVYLLLAIMIICSISVVYAEGVISAELDGTISKTQLPFAEDRVLVVLKPEVGNKLTTHNVADFLGIGCKSVTNLTAATSAIIEAKINGTVTRGIDGSIIDIDVVGYQKILCLELNEGGIDNLATAIKKLSQRSDVLYAEPDWCFSIDPIEVIDVADTDTTLAFDPADAYYADQWALQKIQAPQAWDYTMGASSVVVGVIDTGIDSTHPDLSARMYYGLSKDFSTGSSIDSLVPSDENGHGTHVAGIIAASSNNGIGIAGIAGDIKLASLQVANENGYGYASYIITAIDYARSVGIPILNMSITFETRSSNYANYFNVTTSALRTAISNYSGLLVCSSGKNTTYQNNDTNPVYPGEYRLPNVISVSSSNSSDRRSTNAHIGATSVDIFAPGDNIISTYPNSRYVYMSGSSMAAPHVAGVAALVLSRTPGLNGTQLKTRIMNNVDNVTNSGGGSVFGSLCVSGGRLNAYKAITNAAG